MYFDNHKNFAQARINPDLFWEYDLNRFDFLKEISVVVQRVIERGASDDFYAMFNLYGVEGVIETIKKIPSFSQRDMEFINNVLCIPYYDLAAYQNMTKYPHQWPHQGVPIRL
ncbi:MAG: hypothetical protein K2U26_17240 [Cyclobacteriaceae bacterium]|nr:hypothetical protein [Cyclobacteriaceae bacterium]